ncbi:glycerophosphoryl diester phosphodiesterase membrane domain-containing protein [Cellulomonas wangsupingiae]|uniref:glycerophosphoryl diester phosphodiesterase membrane domain-containing protein n=1 Tax=Cellulomonas wangsupingiae TaxID=2968085 RepID=UPI001D0F1E11|nr:glycerophosphoryl diester phosphodiesterase membrane domain-containing protein [Cellulomonas wangsupingiae]MCM0640281.1 glycerophosphoryl diester phosphodiesterase membrane domain-containing protein [Cellulomonas wangsupingiae]
MTSPQDDGAGPAGWASPAGPPAGGRATPPPPPAAPGAPGGASSWGEPPTPPAWGGPAAPTGWGPAAAPPGTGAAPPVAGTPGWHLPVLQPGIIPLRPLGLGEILDGAVRAIRANPAVMFGLSAVVVTVAVALQTLVQLYVSSLLGMALGDAALEEGLSSADTAVMSELLSTSGGQVLTQPLLVPVTSVLTGLLIVSVSQSVLGRRVALREVWRTRRVWFLVGWGLLQLLASLLAAALGVGAVVALAAAGATGAAVATALLGGVALFAALVWVTTRTLLVPPALMLEGKPFWSSVARAWRLTRGSFWRLLGIYVLANLLVLALMYLFVVPAGMVAGLVSLSSGSDDITVLVSAVAQVLGMTLSTTFLAAVVALLYVDVRIRREGLDLELARAAAADA